MLIAERSVAERLGLPIRARFAHFAVGGRGRRHRAVGTGAGHPQAARAIGHEDRRLRRHRVQRGLRRDRAHVAGGVLARSRAAQPPGWRHRHRPPAGGERGAASRPRCSTSSRRPAAATGSRRCARAAGRPTPPSSSAWADAGPGAPGAMRRGRRGGRARRTGGAEGRRAARPPVLVHTASAPPQRAPVPAEGAVHPAELGRPRRTGAGDGPEVDGRRCGPGRAGARS